MPKKGYRQGNSAKPEKFGNWESEKLQGRFSSSNPRKFKMPGRHRHTTLQCCHLETAVYVQIFSVLRTEYVNGNLNPEVEEKRRKKGEQAIPNIGMWWTYVRKKLRSLQNICFLDFATTTAGISWNLRGKKKGSLVHCSLGQLSRNSGFMTSLKVEPSIGVSRVANPLTKPRRLKFERKQAAKIKSWDLRDTEGREGLRLVGITREDEKWGHWFEAKNETFREEIMNSRGRRAMQGCNLCWLLCVAYRDHILRMKIRKIRKFLNIEMTN